MRGGRKGEEEEWMPPPPMTGLRFNKEKITMEKLLKGKVALVTGASKGIGAGIAKALGAAGTSVVVNYSRSKESADKVKTEETLSPFKAMFQKERT